MRLLIGLVVGVVGLIDAHAVRPTPGQALLVAAAELNEAKDPAREVDAASQPGAGAA